MFYHCFRAATDVCWAVKMIFGLLSIEICVHVIDNGNNEVRGGGVERDAGGDEKQSSLPGLRLIFNCTRSLCSHDACSVL